MNGKSQTFLQNPDGIVFVCVEKVDGIFSEGKAAIGKIMHCRTGKFDADDTVGAVFRNKLIALGCESENAINTSDSNIGKEHGFFSSCAICW